MANVVKETELGPMGYRIHANPNTNDSNSDCVKKMSKNLIYIIRQL